MNYPRCSLPYLHHQHNPEVRQSSEQERLIIPTCHHILPSGRLCRCAARRGQRFCRHHTDLRVRRLRAGRAERQIRLRFRMPRFEDGRAVQFARARVRYAVAAGHIEPAIGRQVLWALGVASSNFRYMQEQARASERSITF
jgi:hypothetical protein